MTAFAQVARAIRIEDVASFQKVLLVIFELPSDKYLAFRFISTEIIESLSDLLREKDPGSNEYMFQMAQQFIKYATDGLKIAQTEEASAKCFLKLCQHTKAYMHTFAGEIIENIF